MIDVILKQQKFLQVQGARMADARFGRKCANFQALLGRWQGWRR